MQEYERLGAFYLGRQFDLERRRAQPDLVLYDSKDLTTHAVCVGMTGSGKTGLCLSLLEEAALDGIPAIAIDPKGDLGNLLLSFPNLTPDEFRPWIEDGEAARHGMTPDQYAAQVAKRWRAGLAQWDQDGERIGRFRESVDLAIYTPGSNSGLPLAVLHSFAAPPAAVINDSDALRERISASASGLLALLGISADPIRSREHILLSNIFHQAWKTGRGLDIAGMIRDIQQPPFNRVGIMDLESFYPARDRFSLSMQLNNLVASPSFASWMEGEPLDVKRLLYTPQGKPRLSIISIAHLSESERMFFVTILLNEVLAWTRSQAGTSSLRALLYMDEVFGYFPPTRNPPSKLPMLTLLKQARAYGVGVVLATQNPVDLDYKGLSNAGTWFLGRLQTERDKARVLDGLEGASTMTGVAFDRHSMETILSGLDSRVFLMNNVHDDEPVVFQTRWAMSYLRGPLTRRQIQTLMAPRKQSGEASTAAVPSASDYVAPAEALTTRSQASAGAASTDSAPPISPNGRTAESDQTTEEAGARPILPPESNESFIPPRRSLSGRLVYRPALMGVGRCHFVRATYGGVDMWKTFALMRAVHDDDLDDPWDDAQPLVNGELEVERAADPRFQFGALPSELTNAKKYSRWEKDLKDFLYREKVVTVWKCAELKEYSLPDQSEENFRLSLVQLAKEKRDLEVEKLRKRCATKMATLKGQLLRAQQRVDREKAEYQSQGFQTAISFGTSILGALLGRKAVSVTNMRRTGSAIRSAGRTAQQRGDIARAEDSLEAVHEKLEKLDAESRKAIDKIKETIRVDQMEFEPLEIRPRKTDIMIETIALVWTPWRVDENGIAESAY